MLFPTLRVHPKVVARGRLMKNPYYIPNAESLRQPVGILNLNELAKACRVESLPQSAFSIRP